MESQRRARRADGRLVFIVITPSARRRPYRAWFFRQREKLAPRRAKNTPPTPEKRGFSYKPLFSGVGGFFEQDRYVTLSLWRIIMALLMAWFKIAKRLLYKLSIANIGDRGSGFGIRGSRRRGSGFETKGFGVRGSRRRGTLNYRPLVFQG